MEGSVKKRDKLTLLNTQNTFEALEVGYFKPGYFPTDEIKEGEDLEVELRLAWRKFHVSIHPDANNGREHSNSTLKRSTLAAFLP